MKNSANPRILVVEDDESTRWLIGQVLQQISIKVEILYAASASEGNASLEQNPVDLVVCDYHMGDTNGLDVLKYLRSVKSKIPFILFTSEHSQNIPHVAYLQYSYIQKPDTNKLLAEIENFIEKLQ